MPTRLPRPPDQMWPRLLPVLRVAVAVAGLCGIFLAVLNLLDVEAGAIATTGYGELRSSDPRVIVPRVLNILTRGAGYAALGLVFAWKVGDEYAALMAGLFLAFTSMFLGLARAPWALGEPWLVPTLGIGIGLANAAGIRFTQLFPEPLIRADVAETWGPPWLRRTVLRPLGVLLAPWFLWPMVVGLQATIVIVSANFAVRMLFTAAISVMGTVYLYSGFRRADEVGRQRIFWVLEGVAAILITNAALASLWMVHELGIVDLDVAVWAIWLDVVKGGAAVTCFALAIFYSGAFPDSGLVLRRTAVLSASGTVMVVIFISVETAISELLPALVGVESRFGTIMGGVVAALAFRPLSDFLDKRVRKWIGRDGVETASGARAE